MAHAQVTPAATNINNFASASFARPGGTDSVLSNTITTRVAATYIVRVTPPGTVAAPAFSLFGAPGDTLYARIAVDNLGNAPDSVAMSSNNLPPSSISVASVVFFLDANANNRFDPGEDDPAFLAIARAASAPVDVAIVLPLATGISYLELRATSARDPNLPPASDATVVRVNSGAVASALHFGPAGNARALPGGDGSSDDETSIAAGLLDDRVVFRNDVENGGTAVDDVEVFVANASLLPAGVSISCTDTSGIPLPASPRPGAFLLGALAPGETRPVLLAVESPGTPLRFSLGANIDLSCFARSTLDSTAVNRTTDRVLMPALPDPLAVIGLEQTFRQATAAVGDVVTMTMTVTNRTDSLAVDNVLVTEAIPPTLDFLGGGSGVARAGASIEWDAGTLPPGESRSSNVKFVVNSRESKGWARVSGTAVGEALSGDRVTAGPVVASIRIDNEEWGLEGFLLGDVWVDDDGDGERDELEPGVPDVSLYLESGEHVVTDSLGVFSIPHVFEGYRVVRLDEGSLPAELGFDQPLGPAKDGAQPATRRNERLVHLLAPAHARVAFPLRRLPSPTVESREHVRCDERISVVPRARMEQEFVLPSSYFLPGKAVLDGSARDALTPVANFLADHAGWQLLVEGHTDNVPIRTRRFPSNYELSVARAEAVREVLVSLGVPAERVLALGSGEQRPVASNTTADGRMLNRRVEVSFIPPGHATSTVAQKVAAAVRDVSTMPDSARTTIAWSLTTTSQRPQRGTLRVNVPRSLAGVEVSASMGDSLLGHEGSEFAFENFARDHAIECRISFTIALADTQRIRDVTATLTLFGDAASPVASTPRGLVAREGPVSPPPAAGPMRSYNPPSRSSDQAPAMPVVVTFRPSVSKSSVGSFEALAWMEQHVVAQSDTAGGGETGRVTSPRGGEPTGPAVEARGPVVILDPGDDEVYANRDQASVRVRHPLGSRVMLLVNGESVEEEHIGQRTVDIAREVETTTWYGVRLSAGWNQIVARASLLRGGDASDSVRVALSSRPAEVVALDERHVIPADGRSRVTVRFAVRDGFGLPVMDGWTAALVEGAELVVRTEKWMTRDGLVSVEVEPRHATGAGRITIELDGMRASTEVVFVTPDRPLLAAGVVDLSAGIYQKGGAGSGQGLDNFTDGLDGNAEARLFVQGAAPGDVSVTARVDTKKRYDDPLLKQPDPEKQYPMFGDASSLHYAAPARGGNYLSLDRGQSYLRYGDFRTPIDRGEFLTYQQVVSGLSTALVEGPSSVRAFVTETDFVTVTDDIPADGTSGFYYLSRAPMVENSERVVIETRDRFQSEIVLEARVMLRRRDYTVNPYDGSILFMEPVPVTDRELNPNTIVVTYETETDGADAFLFGVRGDLATSKRYRAGLTAVANSGDGPGYALYGVDGEARWRGLRASGEIARSNDDAVGDGDAYKVGLAAAHGTSELDVYLRRVDGDFSNPSFRGADSERASVKAGFDGRWAATPRLSVNADGYTHELQQTDERRETARATVDYRRRLLEMSAGLRVARHDEPETAGNDDARGVLALAGLTVGNRGTFGVSTTLEQNLGDEIVDDYPNRLKTVLAAPLYQHFRAIATYEYATASNRPSTHQITAGVEGTGTHGTQAYTRYALDRAASDARMGAVSGIRQKLRLDESTSATLGVEAFLSMAGRDDDEYVSLTAGLGSKRLGSHFVEGGYEYRWEARGDKHLVRLSGAQQLGGGFAWLTKNVLGVGSHELEPGRSREDAQYYATLAGAYRSPHAPVQSLAMLKSYYDRYAPIEPDAIRWRAVASIDVNAMPSPQHELRFKYAYKHVEDWSDAVSLTTDTDLVLGQYVWHFGRGWDVDAWGRALRIRDGGSREYGAGIELGRMVYRSIRIGVGYSLNGFDDPDVSTTDAWSRGFGVRLHMILSDWLLADFEGLEK